LPCSQRLASATFAAESGHDEHVFDENGFGREKRKLGEKGKKKGSQGGKKVASGQKAVRQQLGVWRETIATGFLENWGGSSLLGNKERRILLERKKGGKKVKTLTKRWPQTVQQ